MIRKFILMFVLLVNISFARVWWYGMGGVNYDFIAMIDSPRFGVLSVDKFNKTSNKILHNDDKKYKKLDIDYYFKVPFGKRGFEDDFYEEEWISFKYMIGFGYTSFEIPQGLDGKGIKYNLGLELLITPANYLTAQVSSAVSTSGAFDLDNKNRVLFTLGPKYWPMITLGYEYRIFKVKDFKSNNHSLMLGFVYMSGN